MTANETDPAAGTKSTSSEAPAEAASDAPTGNPPQPHPTLPEGMGDLDRRAVDTARVLAMDAVQKAGNGHPGTAVSVGPTAYLLFQKWLRAMIRAIRTEWGATGSSCRWGIRA